MINGFYLQTHITSIILDVYYLLYIYILSHIIIYYMIYLHTSIILDVHI